MLAAVAGEVAVVAVDHGQAGAHVAGEIERGDTGTEREGSERVPEIVDPPQRLDPGRDLRRPPLPVAEVVQVEVAAPLGGEHECAFPTRSLLPDRFKRDRLQRHCSPARVGLRALQPTFRERAVDIENARLQVEVAPFEREPFRPGEGPMAAAKITIGR
jgi:hypothetical protein